MEKPIVGQNKKPNPKPKGRNCFVAGTLILTANGLIPIENIAVGDSVWAYSDSLHIIQKQRVYTTVAKTTAKLVDLQIGNTHIYTTPEHPFYIKNKWAKADDLKVGDSVLLYNGSKNVITQKITKDTVCAVYNFGVEYFKTYFVSDLKVLVHNNDDCNLPTLDATGKVHGTLPHIKDLGKYSNEALVILKKELEFSVKTRIRVTSKLGRDRAHGQRQAAEQQLIKDITTHLNGK